MSRPCLITSPSGPVGICASVGGVNSSGALVIGLLGAGACIVATVAAADGLAVVVPAGFCVQAFNPTIAIAPTHHIVGFMA
jgi:hypothetical protein